MMGYILFSWGDNYSDIVGIDLQISKSFIYRTTQLNLAKSVFSLQMNVFFSQRENSDSFIYFFFYSRVNTIRDLLNLVYYKGIFLV